jgi:hypothetical protein
MAAAIVAQHVGGVVAAGSATTAVVPSGVTTKTGNSIVVWVNAPNATTVTVTSVTDTQSNTYAQDVSLASSPDGVWRCQSATSLSTSDTITVHFSAAVTVSGAVAWADEIYGIDSVTPLDTTPQTKTATSTVSPTTPAITTVSNNTLVLTGLMSNGACGTTLTVSSPYTQIAAKVTTAGTSTGAAILVAQQTIATAGAVAAGNFSQDSHSYAGVTIAYRGARTPKIMQPSFTAAMRSAHF